MFFFMSMTACLHVCLCSMYMQCLLRPEEGDRYPTQFSVRAAPLLAQTMLFLYTQKNH